MEDKVKKSKPRKTAAVMLEDIRKDIHKYFDVLQTENAKERNYEGAVRIQTMQKRFSDTPEKFHFGELFTTGEGSK